MSVKHNWEVKVLYIQYHGAVTGEEMISSALRVGGDARFDDLRYIISDWTDCSESNVSVEDVEKLAAFVAAMAKTNAHITNLNVMHEDFNRQAFVNLYMYLTDKVPWQELAFRTLDDARVWLQGAPGFCASRSGINVTAH